MPFSVVGAVAAFMGVPPVQSAVGQVGRGAAPVTTPAGTPQEVVSFSPAARQLAGEEAGKQNKQTGELKEEDKRRVADMKRREQAVIVHENAHKAAGGQYASAPHFGYARGPDGKVYVVDGEVSIDTSKVSGNPQGTMLKAQQVRAAALAPSDPSGQDLQVAAAASRMAMDAQSELVKEQQKELQKQPHADKPAASTPSSPPSPIDGDQGIKTPLSPPMAENKGQVNPYAEIIAQTFTGQIDGYRSISLMA